MRGCDEELCPNWSSSDGMVCPCAVLGVGQFDDDSDDLTWVRMVPVDESAEDEWGL